ncbi:hypothetical protein MUK42_04074 [Musa troglodytarum]|uniref:Enhanced disease resistance 4-like N-terminal domain-containing protein n=1 Tax=Musa troglodytarum TaxID=320322 RepID=A0A9E7GFA6_9LILI|nr:hypothetical protein MUK42_04074 [Musa troglodytarum]
MLRVPPFGFSDASAPARTTRELRRSGRKEGNKEKGKQGVETKEEEEQGCRERLISQPFHDLKESRDSGEDKRKKAAYRNFISRIRVVVSSCDGGTSQHIRHALLKTSDWCILAVMASTVPPFRIVRCPRCKKLLTEFANVPMYQCGGCGTTLRAKLYNATRKDIVVPPLENKSENRPDCGSLDNGLQSENETAVCATNDRVQSADSPNPQSSSVEASNNCYKIGGDESENQEERGLDSESLKLTNERIALDHSLNVVDKSSDARQQGHENLKTSERTQDSNESSSRRETASSEDNWSNRSDHDRHGNNLRSASRNSNANDDSVSSTNGVSDSDAPRKRIPVSRRTFRQRKAQDSEDTTNAHKGEEVNKMTAGTQVRVQEVSQKPLIEKSADADRFDSNANELSTENIGYVSKDTSLDSEDFHSVQNWLEPENDGHLRSLPTDAELPKGSAKENDGHLRSLSMDAELPKGSAKENNGHLGSLPTEAELLKVSAKENDGHLGSLPMDAELLKGSANARNGSPPAELSRSFDGCRRC